MKSSARKVELASASDLFTTEQERQDTKLEKVQNIPLSELYPFPDHPFSVGDDDSMKETVESVKEYGVLMPAIARPREGGGYELVAGHRCKHACELAGLDAMPVIVRDLNRDTAIIFMVDSNIQRENILPSERAKAYKMKLEAIKRQGARTDLIAGIINILQASLQTDKMKGIIYLYGGLYYMEGHGLSKEQINAFGRHLRSEEREAGTIEKYLRNIRAFFSWLGNRPVTKGMAAGWKEHLRAEGYQPGTVNSMLSALNKFFAFAQWAECRVKYLKVQRRMFRSMEKELTKAEYLQLLETAHNLGKPRLALLMETICATGIRVSEVKYITVEAIRAGRADIALKGKIRTILLPGKLCRKLQKYAKKQKIASGEVFLTRNGKGLSRRQIWAEMKAICKQAGVAPSKVFPHNLRHLFARTFYHASRDVAKLADVLGHSSIETTRIYLISTGTEHARQLERLGLIP